MAFHDSYSNLLNQLPPSLIKAGWIRLTTRKRNPLTESEASDVSPIIEAFLKHEVDRYQRKKKYRYNPTHHIQNVASLSVTLNPKDNCSTIKVPIQTNSEASNKTYIQVSNSEDEINTRIKEATDILREDFTKATYEKMLTLKQQKEAECNQIKVDMDNRNVKLFEHTLKKYIRDSTIYNLIHELEEKDGKLYPDMSMKN